MEIKLALQKQPALSQAQGCSTNPRLTAPERMLSKHSYSPLIILYKLFSASSISQSSFVCIPHNPHPTFIYAYHSYWKLFLLLLLLM